MREVAAGDRQQPGDEPVVRVLLDRTARAARPIGAPVDRSSHKAAIARDARPRRRAARRRTRSAPSTTASCAPPLRPATAGTPHAAASRKTMPNPSASSPPHRSRQHIANTSAHAYTSGRSASATRPRKCTSGRPRARRCEPRTIAARAADRELNARQAGDRIDHDVEALPRHEARQAEHERAIRDRGRSAAASPTCGRRRAGGTDRRRRPAGRARRAARAPRRVPPGAPDIRRRPRPRPPRATPCGRATADPDRAGNRDLGAVRDHDVRRARAAADRSRRAAASGRRTSTSAPTSRARRRRRGPDAAEGKSTFCARAHDPERLRASHSRRAFVRCREHRRLARRQPPPQLVQVRLDATDLRRKVVRDQQARHRRGCYEAAGAQAGRARAPRRPRRSRTRRDCPTRRRPRRR